jgi:hypothetical protein
MIRRGRSKPMSYLKDSANMLSDINYRVEKLIKHLKEKYENDPMMIYYIKKLDEQYDSSIISEAAIDTRYTTFTVDKKDVHICLRTRDNKEKMYDINLLMYVVLHELAHMCNYDIKGNAITGHGREFIDKFKILVSEAINIGVYKYTDYNETPQEYCGMLLSSTIIPKNRLLVYTLEDLKRRF